MERRSRILGLSLLCLSLLICSSLSFQSDELLVDDEDFGLEGGVPAPEIEKLSPRLPSTPTPATVTAATRRRSLDSESDSKVQFTLEHAFGDADFSPAGTFTARVISWPNGGQTLTKLRFSRNTFTDVEMEKFKALLQEDDFYRVRLPSNIVSPPGRNYTVSSTKARCLPRDSLDEHIVIHMEGINIVAVNYGSIGACPHPRLLKFPSKWSFNSHTILKHSEQASRAPVFTEEVFGGPDGEGEAEKLPEKSFWAKYWMYLVPLGFVVMNAMTQAMNVPEEPAAGSGGQVAAPAARGAGAPVRRR